MVNSTSGVFNSKLFIGQSEFFKQSHVTSDIIIQCIYKLYLLYLLAFFCKFIISAT